VLPLQQAPQNPQVLHVLQHLRSLGRLQQSGQYTVGYLAAAVVASQT